ncbi:hypothetical protein C0993_001498 [Termitomyces sp. T159_Od127]|nr:hypothetical protein C0993_001498 [Termitomyces sp. T159_Od127]
MVRPTRTIQPKKRHRPRAIPIRINIPRNTLRRIPGILRCRTRLRRTRRVKMVRRGGAVQAEERDSAGLRVLENVARDALARVPEPRRRLVRLVVVGGVEVVNDLAVIQAVERDGAVAVAAALEEGSVEVWCDREEVAYALAGLEAAVTHVRGDSRGDGQEGGDEEQREFHRGIGEATEAPPSLISTVKDSYDKRLHVIEDGTRPTKAARLA